MEVAGDFSGGGPRDPAGDRHSRGRSTAKKAPRSRACRDGTVTLPNIETFVVSARSGSLAAGADALGVSPSAISSAIKRLERQLCVKLYARGKPKRLTPEGEVLLGKAGALVFELRSLLDQPFNYAALPSGRASLGDPESRNAVVNGAKLRLIRETSDEMEQIAEAAHECCLQIQRLAQRMNNLLRVISQELSESSGRSPNNARG